MRFDDGIGRKYKQSIKAAFKTIAESGTDEHRRQVSEIEKSDMLIRCGPVSQVNASGRTGLINAAMTNVRMLRERFTLRDALGEIYIVIAEETIDTGRQQGCEGTFVHEGRHALDFAQVIESMSNRDMNPLDVYDPTLYELEWNAHKTAGDYMLAINKQEYLDEGLQLMILGLGTNGECFVDDAGIQRRLSESYGLARSANEGPSATKLLGIMV
jgi:hypothetical protein